jgi:hypothetical protein
LDGTDLWRVGLAELVETVDQGLPCNQKPSAASGGSCATQQSFLHPAGDCPAMDTEDTGDLTRVGNLWQSFEDDGD